MLMQKKMVLCPLQNWKNKLIVSQCEKWKGHGKTWPFHFNKIYFSYETKVRKPDEAVFNLILKQNNLKPNKTLFVDDTLEHIEYAKNANAEKMLELLGE